MTIFRKIATVWQIIPGQSKAPR